MWLKKCDTRLTTLDEAVMVIIDNFDKNNVKINGIRLFKFNDSSTSVTFVYGSQLIHIEYVTYSFKDERYITCSTDSYSGEFLRVFSDHSTMELKKTNSNEHYVDIPNETFNEIDFFQYEVLGVINPLQVSVLCKLKDKMKDFLNAIPA